MSNYCDDCGSKVYRGLCTSCNEETFIAEQNADNDDPIAFSEEFCEKLARDREQQKRRLAIISYRDEETK